MKLFVSYARVDKPFCKQLVDLLDIHDVWYDYRLHIGQSWWDEITRRLDWCEGMVFLVSPDSLASQYCNQELDIALKLNKHIFPVLIRRDVKIPEKLLALQYADFSSGIDVSATKILLNSISIAERQAKALAVVGEGAHTTLPVPPSLTVIDKSPPTIKDANVDCLSEAIKAMNKGDYDTAVYLLKQLLEGDKQPRFVDVEMLLAQAERKLQYQMYQKEAEREYAPIAVLMKNDQTRALGCNAFRAYLNTFSDYDPLNLRKIYDEEMRKQPPLNIEAAMPFLAWCPVPQGRVSLRQNRTNKTFLVKDFQISQYPITNAQFQAFIDAPDGYQNPVWWERSSEVRRWHNQRPVPIPAPPSKENHPRVNVNWYEAVAFCDWLSHKIGFSIRLPTEQQWQRAATGDTRNLYTWGSRFDKTMANTKESGFRTTTVVTQYPRNISPFGVWDMIGNTWEWCANGFAKGEVTDLTVDIHRVVRGGSFLSPKDRCTAQFSYALNPYTRYHSIGFRIVCDYDIADIERFE